MAPWWLEEMAGRAWLIKYQLTKLLIPMLPLLPRYLGCYHPSSSTGLTVSSLPHRGLTARLGRQTEAQSSPGRGGGGASSSSIWLPPDRHNHTRVSYPDKILFRVVKIADTEDSLGRLTFSTLRNWGEFWNVGSLTSQSLLSTFQLCLSTSNHYH